MKPNKVYFPASFTGEEKHTLRPVFKDDEVYIRKASLMRLLRAKIKRIREMRGETQELEDMVAYQGYISCFEEVIWDIKNMTKR